jgi:hypothetical protein
VKLACSACCVLGARCRFRVNRFLCLFSSMASFSYLLCPCSCVVSSIRSSCGENLESGEQIYGGAELHGVLLRGLLGARLRGHRAHAPPPGLRPRPQARRIHLRPRRQPLPGGQFLFSASSFLVVTFSAVTHVLFRPKKSYCPSSPRQVIKV